MNSSETLQADIVIIGGGGAGLTAASAAVEAGAKNVIVLETRNSLGGNAKVAHGFFAAESQAQKRMGIDAPRDVLFRMHMEYTHWRTNARLVRTFIDKSAEAVRWLEEKGCRFENVAHIMRNQIPVFHVNPKPCTGRPLANALIKSCKDLGVRVLFRTRGKKLLTDEKGKVIGVLANAKDKEIRIMAKSVIIATGGCLGNKELLKKYFPAYSEGLVDAGLPSKGDGLLMATEIGAATEGLGVLNFYGPDFKPYYRDLFRIVPQPNTIWVNKRGERFADEGTHTRTFANSSNAIARQPSAMSYTLFDQKIKESNIEEGLAGGPMANVFKGERYFWGKADIPKLDKEFQLQADRGKLKISDSWDEIAKWIGASPKVLKATIDEYNSFCDRGHDEIFAKDRMYLIPLRTPPYYAMECHVHIYTTVGGIKINHHMEVLDSQEKPIPGLYAIGVDTGGWEEDTYNYILAGTALCFAVTSGLIAGENAAKYISKKGK
jgi:fumarate reductase flavoprotein subunit